MEVCIQLIDIHLNLNGHPTCHGVKLNSHTTRHAPSYNDIDNGDNACVAEHLP